MQPNVEEQLQRALSLAHAIEPIELSVREARGCVLAVAANCQVAVPSAAVAEADGFAVNSASLSAASPAQPVVLRVVDRVGKGMHSDTAISATDAVAIDRGAPLPAECDGVVINADVIDNDVVIAAPTAPGAHVVGAGALMAVGAEVLPEGTLVGDRQIAALVAAGVARVVVHPRARTSVVTVGDDLCDISRVVTHGLRPDAVSAMLTTSALDAGAEAYRGGPVPETAAAMSACIQDQLVRSDVVVLSVDIAHGGDGPTELLTEALATADCRGVAFGRVDPGGWVGVGTVGEDDIPLIIVDSTVLGAYVAFEVFVRPVLRALAGHRELFRPVVRARTSAAGQSLAGVRSFLPATLTLSDGGFAAEPYPPRAGAAPFWLHEPNALMIIPERLTSVSAGDEVALIRLDRQ